jgi:hypothetical protein
VSALSAANGIATIEPAGVGELVLRATKPGDAPSAPVTVCVHNGDDGRCGTQLAQHQAAAPYTGPFALVAAPGAPLDGHVYRAARAPRLLSGSIRGHSAVNSVSLELRRSFHGRCWAFDATRARFVRARCGKGTPFAVSSGATYSYLLPKALPRGRYVLDVLATDTAGNRTALARGTSRIVFYVA